MTRADIVVIFAAVALLPWLYLRFWTIGGAGDEALIWVDGVEQAPVSLYEDRKLTVHGALGDSILEVRNGRLRFLSSPCSGKVCVHTGWIEHTGEFAACLPNHVSVSIVGDAMRYDAINF